MIDCIILYYLLDNVYRKNNVYNSNINLIMM